MHKKFYDFKMYQILYLTSMGIVIKNMSSLVYRKIIYLEVLVSTWLMHCTAPHQQSDC